MLAIGTENRVSNPIVFGAYFAIDNEVPLGRFYHRTYHELAIRAEKKSSPLSSERAPLYHSRQQAICLHSMLHMLPACHRDRRRGYERSYIPNLLAIHDDHTLIPFPCSICYPLAVGAKEKSSDPIISRTFYTIYHYNLFALFRSYISKAASVEAEYIKFIIS